MKTFILLWLTMAIPFSFVKCQAPTNPESLGLKAFHIASEELGDIHFYVTVRGIQSRKPLVLFLDGSGHYPLFTKVKTNDSTSQVYGSIPFRQNQLAEQFHIAFISKPGTPLIDSVRAQSQEDYMQNYLPSEEYTARLSLDWRAESASLVIDFLMKELQVDTSHVTAIGYSEGGQVVPKLATLNPNITKIVNIVGGGLNQLYDFIAEQRTKATLGQLTGEEAQLIIDSLIAKYQDIYTHPESTDKFWYGHSYKRWASFCSDVPMDNMLELDIPILLIAAGNDQNSPIVGIDYVPLEFVRNGKTNLTYKVYPNCDHFFSDRVSGKHRLDEMFEYVWEWVKR